MSTAEKVTADTIRAALKERYPAPEYAVLFEVTDATGARNTRSADAVVMSCWPSRGLELHGIEIKVSRSDWLHERRQPNKAETIAAYCDRWWLVTGPGVVNDVIEIPPAWGWAEYVPAHTDLTGKRTAARLLTRKEPSLTDSKPIDRLFLASLLRNAARVSSALIEQAQREVRAEAEATIEDRVKERLERRNSRMTALAAQVEGFEAATGIKLDHSDTWETMSSAEGRKIGEMVMAVRKANLGGAWDGLNGLYVSVQRMAATLEEHATALGITVATPKKRGRA